MFAAAQQMNNPGGLEFNGSDFRAVATIVAAGNSKKAKFRRQARERGVSLKPWKPAGARRAWRRARCLEGRRQREEHAALSRGRGAENMNPGAQKRWRRRRSSFCC
jgi:hypothetical protein